MEKRVKNIPMSLSEAEATELAEFLDGSKRPEGTLCFHELQGFLFAIACSPETIPSSDWLPAISDDKDPGFKDENEAQRILTSAMALYNEVNTSVLNRSNTLPRRCQFEDKLFANFDEDASISQWSQGFAVGHDWLSDIWECYLIDEMEEEFGATLMVLSYFGSRQLAEAYFTDANPHRSGSDKAFRAFTEKIRELFPEALASYAHMGRTIFEFLLERESGDDPQH